ncbi:class I tRNA ligase family protein [Mesorhizobium sp. VK23B]|uniref:Class I tRNA ligase family protein n=1 Tax=Mesorhizobium dulcispinae TaxID=3072316 RepID=A0ABU4XNP2_9HYPH|nr:MULTISPECIES: class I tRNA ligase family protein [unclassified Mesorhizobium]MDX8470029.1 class I tRNA ligase family protein [Mesorhizobium sp. VK23B]MDX8476368.1 class I tRNA ligase family protein [Mesorhizobium sp. VK23A]
MANPKFKSGNEMIYPQIIDLKNEARAVPVSIDGGIVRHDPFPEGGNVSVRLLKFSSGATTCRHNHGEVEFWTVISGGVRIHLDEEAFLLLGGESIRIDPLRRHRIEALDSGAVMQTVWWHSRAEFEEAISTKEATAKDRPLLLVPAMLTPNGHMHIGHASGPFLHADVLRRIAETGDREVFVLQGTHGHLEHIAIAADAAGLEYYQLAEKNTASFQEALDRLNAVPDIFLGTEPDRRGKAVVLEVFKRLCSKGLIAEREHLVPYDVESGRFRVDAFVHGKCPYCGGYASGHECEDCGALVLDAELQDPVDLEGRSLERRPLKRLFLNLAPMHDALESFASRSFLPIYAKHYIESWLSRGLPEVCISNPNREGIRIPIPGFECQRFNITIEHVPRHLLALEMIREKSGCPALWYQIPRDEMPELNILFGADNAFGRLLVIPGVLSALDLHEMLPRRIFVNQMLTLDGKKFSTSRNHAIWVNDITAKETGEPLRFYLCRRRPDGCVEDFSLSSYESWKRNFWDGRLLRSTGKANQVIERVATDELPCPGQWSATDIAFLAECRRFNAEVRARFEADYPDVRQLTHAIEAFVDAIDRYSCSVLHVPAAAKENEALDRTAARAVTFALVGLCVAAYPLIPDFAARIAGSLGLGVPKLSWLDRDWIAEPVRLPEA